jgi:hypothetical protein
MDTTTARRCIALYSGGLDSILAVKIIQEQGIDVTALYFCTPYFGLDALLDPATFEEEHRRLYGVHVRVVDYSGDLAAIVASPRHGFGKHMNPCIDCKIGMLRRARELLGPLGASFVVTGEVTGQRPMSQRRQTMRLIEKESGLRDILLRPLSALLLPETLPERSGVVDRGSLYAVRGRGRKVQMELALKYGITGDILPSPAGGCLLTDGQIAGRVRKTFERVQGGTPSREDLLLDVVGRRFRPGPETVLVVGRNERENGLMARFVHPGNVFLRIKDVPGPLCILRGGEPALHLETAAGICLRYGKARGERGRTAVYGPDPACLEGSLDAGVLTDEQCRALQD